MKRWIGLVVALLATDMVTLDYFRAHPMHQ